MCLQWESNTPVILLTYHSQTFHLPGGKLMMQFYIISGRGRHLLLNRWLLHPNNLFFACFRSSLFHRINNKYLSLVHFISDDFKGQSFSSPFCNFSFLSYMHSNMQTTRSYISFGGIYVQIYFFTHIVSRGAFFITIRQCVTIQKVRLN